MILGITGGTGCGKTTLLHCVAERGGLILDCDEIYHELLETNPMLLAAIEARFPGTVEHDRLQRKRLGELVFSNPAALADLNRITHSAVKTEVLRRLKTKPNLAAIDAIGLFESGLSELCDVTVAVIAPEEMRIARLMKRDNISREYAEARIAAQKSTGWFRDKCDYVLENYGTEEDFRRICHEFLQKLIVKEENPYEYR